MQSPDSDRVQTREEPPHRAHLLTGCSSSYGECFPVLLHTNNGKRKPRRPRQTWLRQIIADRYFSAADAWTAGERPLWMKKERVYFPNEINQGIQTQIVEYRQTLIKAGHQ